MIYEGRRIEISTSKVSQHVIFKERHDVVPTIIASLETTTPNAPLVNYFVVGCHGLAALFGSQMGSKVFYMYIFAHSS